MGGGLTLRIFLSSRFWFVLYQRLFLGKLPWGNPLDHFGNCSSSSAFPNSMLARQGGLLMPPVGGRHSPPSPVGGRWPPTPLRSANDPTPSGPRLITSIKPTSEWECLLSTKKRRVHWKNKTYNIHFCGKPCHSDNLYIMNQSELFPVHANGSSFPK